MGGEVLWEESWTEARALKFGLGVVGRGGLEVILA